MINPKELSYDELDSIVTQILTGTKLVYVKNEKGDEVPILFRCLGYDKKIQADYIYKKKYNDAKKAGILTKEQMEDIIYSRGLYSSEDEEKVRKLEDQLFAQKKVLSLTTRVPANRERLIKIISDLESNIRAIKSKKDSRLQMTCESIATEEKFLFMLRNSVFDISNELYWKSLEDFNDQRDVVFKTNIINEFINFISGIDVSVIRYLARSNIWRIRYSIACKTGADIFGIPVKDYSSDMLNIMYWSNFYTSIYEMLPDDRPSESIIEDDIALDAYMEEYYAEKSREHAVRRSGKRQGNSAFLHDEVIVTKSNPMYQDIEYSKIPKRAERSDDTVISEKKLKGQDKKKKRNKRLG